jgi:hypothetical protein
MFRATQTGGSVVQSEKRAWHAHTSYRYGRGPWRREHFRWNAKSATISLPLSTTDNVHRSAGEGAPCTSSFPLRQDGLQHSASEHATVRHPKSSLRQAVLRAAAHRLKSSVLPQYRSRSRVVLYTGTTYSRGRAESVPHKVYLWAFVVCSVPRTYRRMHER